MTTALAKDDAALREIAGLAKKGDAGDDMPQIPVLKVSYDPEAATPRGTWVVGQTKDQEGNITDEGQIVKGVVILVVRRRYSFYYKKDTDQNCSSCIFTSAETVFGSNYGYNCKSGECPKRAKDADPRCKAQWVVFGMAITDENKLVECIAYIQGTNYMPFDEYRRGLTRVKTDSGFVDVPPFAFVTMLGSEKKRNEGTTYFKQVYSRGPMLKIDQVKMFAEKRDGVHDYIEALNSRVQKKRDEPVTEPSAAPPAAAPAETKPAHAVSTDGTIDVTALTMTETVTKAAPPEDATVAESVTAAPADEDKAEPVGSGADIDIEATIAAALAD